MAERGIEVSARNDSWSTACCGVIRATVGRGDIHPKDVNAGFELVKGRRRQQLVRDGFCMLRERWQLSFAVAITQDNEVPSKFDRTVVENLHSGKDATIGSRHACLALHRKRSDCLNWPVGLCQRAAAERDDFGLRKIGYECCEYSLRT